MDRNDYTRPSGFARWGWFGAALNAVLVALNLANLAFFNASPWAWSAVVICTLSGLLCFRIWRRAVREDVSHRAFMRAHQQRMAEFNRRFGAA